MHDETSREDVAAEMDLVEHVVLTSCSTKSTQVPGRSARLRS
jgi:hypothetical protein